ncbi:MAG: SDR family oxidoreductase [Bacteroidales bacterium]|nr:SDR family oxidoreductase [Bacteroidales bacterium]MBN2757700.1 SDR family oxidoreductase [Bacteroidales bacterium]
MKKIIVTGHSGFIGSILVPLLLEKGFEVVGIDTNYFGKDCEFYPAKTGFTEIIKDTRNIDEKDLKGAYAICHLAALSNDPLGDLDEQLTFDINHLASIEIAKLAKKVGVEKYIYSSSCSLYGIADGDKALAEDADFNPVTAYAKSKVYSERDILPLATDDFSVTFMRNSTAYGISPKLRLDLVVNNLVGWAVTTGQIKIMSDGSPWRPLIHAEDIARAFIAVIAAPKESVNKKSFNVGQTQENFQVRDIANLVGEVVPNCKVVITGEHGSDSRSYRVNFDKIANELPNFEPKWTLKKGIEEIYEAYLKYGMDDEKFNGRYFTRLKQLQHHMKMNKLDNELFWI